MSAKLEAHGFMAWVTMILTLTGLVTWITIICFAVVTLMKQAGN